MKKWPLTYTESEAAELRRASVGDVVVFRGERVRITKKTNKCVAVEPYGIFDIIEDWVLAKLGRWLP